MIEINDLPLEILVHILSFYIISQGYRIFMKNIPLVCKRWNEIHSTPSLWENVLSSFPNNRSRNDNWEKWSWEEKMTLGDKGLLRSCRLLNLYECPFNENDMIKFVRYFHNLKRLEVINNFMPRAVMDVITEQCRSIECLTLIPFEDHMEDVLTQFLNVRGRSVRYLTFCLGSSLRETDWFSTLSGCCGSLESVEFYDSHHERNAMSSIEFSIFELIVGCPKLRSFDIMGFRFKREVKDHQGFKNIVRFRADYTDFGGVELYSIFKNANDLESVAICDCQNVAWSSTHISKIPTEKLTYFCVWDENLDLYNFNFLREIVTRWKLTLTGLQIGKTQNLTQVFEAYLHENSSPKLSRLMIWNRPCLTAEMSERLTRECADLHIYESPF